MSWIAVAIGAGVGILKAEAVDKPKEDRQRKLAAETQRNAWLTGLTANPVQEADPLGSALQYGGAAGGMKQGIANNTAQAELTQNQAALAHQQAEALKTGQPIQKVAAVSQIQSTAQPQATAPANNNPWAPTPAYQQAKMTKLYNDPWTY